MVTPLRPARLPGLLALALLVVCGWTAAPARAADTDWNLVAESIGEAGYYVDSEARYFQNDEWLDLLRNAQDRSTPVFIAVLPASVQPATALSQLKSIMQRKGTYAVLAGDRLEISSTSLPGPTVRGVYTQASGRYPGKPAHTLVAFVRGLSEKKVGKQVTGRTKSPQPVPEPRSGAPAVEDAPLPDKAIVEETPAAAPEESGGMGLLPIAGAAAVLAAAGAGGFVLLRRRRPRSAGPAGPAAPGGPGTPAGPAGPGGPGLPPQQ